MSRRSKCSRGRSAVEQQLKIKLAIAYVPFKKSYDKFKTIWIIFGVIQWVVFVAAVPLSLIALLVFNSVWYRGRHNLYLVFLLVLSLVVLIYLLLLKYNLWQMFLVLAPAELVVILAFNIRKRGKNRHSTAGRVKKAGK